MRNLCLLLKLHLNEEFRFSVFSHEKNPLKKMGFVLKNLVLVCMLLVVALLSFQAGKLLVSYGLGEAIPLVGYIIGSVVTLVVTILKINEILAGKSDAEFLMSLPMGTFLHVVCIFLRLYVWNTLLVALTNIPMVMAYIDEGLAVENFIPTWVVGLLFTCLPLTGMAALVGTVLALCLASLRKSNFVQSIVILSVLAATGITVLKIIYCVKNVLAAAGDVQDVIRVITMNFRAGRLYQGGVILHSPGSLFLFIVYSVVWFLLFTFLISMSYQEVILALRAPKNFIEYDFCIQEQCRVSKAVSKRLWDQWLQSRSYMASTLIGPLFALLISGFFLITKGSGIREILSAQGNLAYLSVPLFLCALIGMGCNTYCGLSMEGKQHWIMQTIPVDEKEIYTQKIIMNLWITEPVALICGIMLWISIKPPVLIGICYSIVPIVYGLLSAIWGMWIDVRHVDYSLDTENQVLRQSISFYLGWLPGVLLPLLLGVLFAVGA
ncbi:MAG: hypothetical protein PUB19_09430 [Lachnospiraceae bacterium]|nr:hypothetical protein [Lachnospiraceae bacterium]